MKKVRITTPYGDMVAQLYSNETPKTVDNFLKLEQSSSFEYTELLKVTNKNMIIEIFFIIFFFFFLFYRILFFSQSKLKLLPL